MKIDSSLPIKKRLLLSANGSHKFWHSYDPMNLDFFGGCDLTFRESVHCCTLDVDDIEGTTELAIGLACIIIGVNMFCTSRLTPSSTGPT